LRSYVSTQRRPFHGKTYGKGSDHQQSGNQHL
jgi:hypothetical protein